MRGLVNPITMLCFLLLASVGIGVFNSTLLPTVPDAHAANVTIVLSACVAACPNVGWNGTTSNPNPTITVTRDDMISLSLSSGDGIPHRFIIDADGDGGQYTDDCPGTDPCSIQFATPISYPYLVTLTPGTWNYYCSLHPSAMFGKFVIKPDLSVGGITASVDKVGLLAPYLASALAILGAIGATILYVRRAKPSGYVA